MSCIRYSSHTLIWHRPCRSSWALYMDRSFRALYMNRSSGLFTWIGPLGSCGIQNASWRRSARVTVACTWRTVFCRHGDAVCVVIRSCSRCRILLCRKHRKQRWLPKRSWPMCLESFKANREPRQFLLVLWHCWTTAETRSASPARSRACRCASEARGNQTQCSTQY